MVTKTDHVDLENGFTDTVEYFCRILSTYLEQINVFWSMRCSAYINTFESCLQTLVLSRGGKFTWKSARGCMRNMTE